MTYDPTDEEKAAVAAFSSLTRSRLCFPKRTKFVVGRTRQQLATLLTEAGYTTEPGNLWAAQGWHRISNSCDNESLRWEGQGVRTADGIPVVFVSDDTMTSLVKSGIQVKEDETLALRYWVSPKRETKP
jgi:hypothetical protein